MKVELKKINVSKSVIDQVKFASKEDILNHREVLGFCHWLVGSGRMKKSINLILFFTEDGDIRKLFDYTRARFNNEHTLSIVRTGFTETTYIFKPGNSRQEFFNTFLSLNMKAKEQGQFFY